MEVQDSHPRTSNQTEVSEPFVAGESSRTNFQDINHAECTNGTNSLQISYSPSSSCLGANSTDEDRQIAEVTKGKSKQKAPQQGNELSQSSSQGSYARKNSQMDVTCSVCLSEFDNKAFLDKCFHAFCYFCILQWSEIVRTCPLCKSSFTSIIHSVKSMTDYQQHYLSKPELVAPLNESQNDGRHFRYRTTRTEARRQQRETLRQWGVNESDARGRRTQPHHTQVFAQRNRGVISQERRRAIYTSNMWVQGVTQGGRPRQRDISPEFFRINPACTHRLIPWLTRDLRVLLNDDESHVGFVLQIILSLIAKVELSSEEFCHQLRPFLFDKTEHFIHEFVSFARSPFDLNAYDERAQYSWPGESDADPVRDTPTVFHSSATDWQSPLPGPSGASLLELSQTEWNFDSPVPHNEVAGWSPVSSPGTTPLNTSSLFQTVTISSSSDSVLSAHLENEDNMNDASPSTYFSTDTTHRGGSSSVLEPTNLDDTERQRRAQSHRHHHKHKYRRERKHKRRHSSKHRSNTHAHRSKEDLIMPGPSDRVSVDSSVSDKPVEVIVIRDSSVSGDTSDLCEDSERNDLAGNGSRRRSRSRSKEIMRRESLRKCNHRCRSRSRDKGKKNHWSRSSSGYFESNSRFDYHSASNKHNHRKSRDRSKRKSDRSHSHSPRRSKARYEETCPSKRVSRWQSEINVVKKEKKCRKKSRSRSRSPSRSHSRSKGDSRTSSKHLKSREHCSRSRGKTSSIHTVGRRSHGSVSCSFRKSQAQEVSPSRADCYPSSRTSMSRSPSPKHTGRSSKSRHMSSSPSYSRDQELLTSPMSEPRESSSLGSETIVREIEELEYRIATDKKRLLQLLIKQEKSKGEQKTVKCLSRKKD